MLYFLRFRKGMRKPFSGIDGPVLWDKSYFGPGSESYIKRLASAQGLVAISERQFVQDMLETPPENRPNHDMVAYFMHRHRDLWGGADDHPEVPGEQITAQQGPSVSPFPAFTAAAADEETPFMTIVAGAKRSNARSAKRQTADSGIGSLESR